MHKDVLKFFSGRAYSNKTIEARAQMKLFQPSVWSEEHTDAGTLTEPPACPLILSPCSPHLRPARGFSFISVLGCSDIAGLGTVGLRLCS